jgi:putative aldouronate transport system permease protein
VRIAKRNQQKQTKRLGVLGEIKNNGKLYLLALPGFVFLFIFSYIPMLGHLVAFEKYDFRKGIFGSPFCGLDNFKFFFMGRDWITVTWNTVFLNSLFIFFGLGLAVFIAIFLSEVKNALFKRVSQSLIFLPYFVSWLVVSLMTYSLLNQTDGLINNVLVSLGLPKVSFYLNANLWPAILTIIYVWKVTGYYSIIFIAAILGISQDYYDSASLDGASKWQQIRFITMPLIRPTFIILLLLCIGRIFYGDFGMIYGIIGDNGVLFPTTDIIDTYTFRALRMLGNFGMSSAVGLYQSVMGLVTILVFNHLIKKRDPNLTLF